MKPTEDLAMIPIRFDEWLEVPSPDGDVSQFFRLEFDEKDTGGYYLFIGAEPDLRVCHDMWFLNRAELETNLQRFGITVAYQ